MDSTRSVKDHIRRVRELIKVAQIKLHQRSEAHDLSKLMDPEKALFDEWIPKLQELQFGSPAYDQAREKMGEALQHHYENNRHHPEYFEYGTFDMNLIDVLEMAADWYAAASDKGNKPDMAYLTSRFDLSFELRRIIENTFEVFDQEIAFVKYEDRRNNARIYSR
jgi:hypothetical protein